jgi:hypothetical protein
MKNLKCSALILGIAVLLLIGVKTQANFSVFIHNAGKVDTPIVMVECESSDSDEDSMAKVPCEIISGADKVAHTTSIDEAYLLHAFGLFPSSIVRVAYNRLDALKDKSDFRISCMRQCPDSKNVRMAHRIGKDFCPYMSGCYIKIFSEFYYEVNDHIVGICAGTKPLVVTTYCYTNRMLEKTAELEALLAHFGHEQLYLDAVVVDTSPPGAEGE